MRGFLPFIFLTLLLPAHIFTLPIAAEQWKALPKAENSSYVLPSPILKITSLEFDGLVSDFLFLKALVFRGGALEREGMKITELERRWIYEILNASTDLDPYFLDPYYFGNANLTWGTDMVEEANILLEKGSRYRDWDWLLPFFIGFNNFYFLQDNVTASEYLMEASKRPGASPTIASLAARLAHKGKKTENAMTFLSEIIKSTEDESLRQEFKKRIIALRGVLFLERAVVVYKQRFDNVPTKLNELIEKGIIREMPVDPYGGEFYIDSDDTIKTTSDMREMK